MIAYRLVSRTTDEFINLGERASLATAHAHAITLLGATYSRDWRIVIM